MAETVVPTNSKVLKWERSFYKEWIRDNRFGALTGADASAPIQLKEDLTKGPGETLDIELVNRLTNSATTGNSVLEGNEEEMKLRNYRISVQMYRNAVVHTGLDEQFSAIDLVEAKRSVLMDWAKELQRDRIIEALGSISIDGATHYAYADAQEVAHKDVWATNNSDRIAFGAGAFNADHSAGITSVDNTTDAFKKTTLVIAKDLAKTANPKIRPLRVKADEEWYVALAGTRAFRSIQADLSSENQYAMERGKGNPLFTGGDLIYDGVIIKEVPEIAPLAGTPGASGTTAVAPVYLLGAQALCHAVANRVRMIQNVRDYGERKGAGVRVVDGIRKIYFGSGASDTSTPKQHGVVTLYVGLT
jgi:N4-gp56 family major capsid protein